MSLKLLCHGCDDKERCWIAAEHEFSNALQGAKGEAIRLRKSAVTLIDDFSIDKLDHQLNRLGEVLQWLRKRGI